MITIDKDIINTSSLGVTLIFNDTKGILRPKTLRTCPSFWHAFSFLLKGSFLGIYQISFFFYKPSFKIVVSSELNKSILLYKAEQNCLCFRHYLPWLKVLNAFDSLCGEPWGKMICKNKIIQQFIISKTLSWLPEY